MPVQEQQTDIAVSPGAVGQRDKSEKPPAPTPPAATPAPSSNGKAPPSTFYTEITRQLFNHVQQFVPIDATVLVVSKGDSTLLHLHGCKAWHYPQREDGVYAGYYPADANAAIEHLESLRAKGANYIVFPATAFWWFNTYTALADHLNSNYKAVVDDAAVCRIYCLDRADAAAEPPKAPQRRLVDFIHPALLPDLRVMLDMKFYATQAGEFHDVEAALLHYLESGYDQGFEPHPLFDTKYYLATHPEVVADKLNPLVHFVTNSVSTQSSCHPIFDVGYYYEQRPEFRDRGVNAVVHYLTADSKDPPAKPNPLFCDEYYLTGQPALKRDKVRPLVHYVTGGDAAGRYGSSEHASIMQSLLSQQARRHLLRGRWSSGKVLIFAEGLRPAETERALKLAEGLAEHHHMRPLTVLMHRSGVPANASLDGAGVVLDDYRIACDIFRASSLRLITRSLAKLSPVFTYVAAGRMVDAVQDAKLPYLLMADSVWPVNVGEAIRKAERVVVESSEDFLHLASVAGRYPVNVASVNSSQQGPKQYASEILELADRTFKLPDHLRMRGKKKASRRRKVIIPCGDWSVSGVNTALQSIGRELRTRGYDVEVVFTRDEEWVAKSAVDVCHMPQIPYRFLKPDQRGPEAMWEALIAHIESSAPCTVLTAYDFAANSVVPALSENVGVVSWVQSDDCDYYEQTYRIGRYCNSVVCVSEKIRQKVTELNPAIGERARIIHNSSISLRDLPNRRYQRGDKLRMIYTGRLVQYQKRVLDVVDLAVSLDRLNVPYEITLVGSFNARDRAEAPFRTRAAAHLADGRIVLAGRLKHELILHELQKNDFFILLSDFEGLPLSLIEAMGAGCVPAVAQMDSGIPEAVTDSENGLIMSGRDYDQWARRLVSQWDDIAGMSRLSERAQETVRTRFTVEQIAQHFADLFDEVAAEINSSRYVRPTCLHWGERISPTGDVLPPATVYRQLSPL